MTYITNAWWKWRRHDLARKAQERNKILLEKFNVSLIKKKECQT